jgi:hypothetical protein
MVRIVFRSAVLYAGLFLASVAQAQDRAQVRPPVRAQLDSISVHLFLSTSGTLSEDVEKIEGFGAWNFSLQGAGIGPNERFYSFLIKVRLTSAGEVFAKGQQADIVVTHRRTRKVVKRERISDVYIGSHGWTVLPVFVEDGACGPFEIVATSRGKRIVKALEAACGE